MRAPGRRNGAARNGGGVELQGSVTPAGFLRPRCLNLYTRGNESNEWVMKRAKVEMSLKRFSKDTLDTLIALVEYLEERPAGILR